MGQETDAGCRIAGHNEDTLEASCLFFVRCVVRSGAVAWMYVVGNHQVIVESTRVQAIINLSAARDDVKAPAQMRFRTR